MPTSAKMPTRTKLLCSPLQEYHVSSEAAGDSESQPTVVNQTLGSFLTACRCLASEQKVPAVTVVGPGSFSLLVLPLTPGLHMGLLKAQRLNSEAAPFFNSWHTEEIFSVHFSE